MSADPVPSIAPRLQELLEQIALELAFVQPDRPGTRLATLLAEVAPLCSRADLPPALEAAVTACDDWLGPPERVAAGLTAETIARLADWQPWMVEAVIAWERGRPLPPLPTDWSAPAPGAASPQRAAPVRIEAAEALEEVAVLQEGGDAELWEMFCAEAHDLLHEIEQSILVLETAPEDAERLNTLFRAFHTLKGNAGVLKLAVLQRFTHELESLLDLARRGRLRLGRDAIDVVLQGADVIRRFVAELERQAAGHDAGRLIALPIPGVVERVRSVIAAGDTAPPAAPAPPAAAPSASATASLPGGFAPTDIPTPIPVPHVPDRLTQEPSAREPVSAPAPVTAPAPIPVPAPAASPATSSLVRVDTQKLDGLIDMVGELVVAQSMVVQSPELRTLQSPHLSWCLGQLRGITGQLQRMALALRMVPVGGTFRRMSRLVRDLAVELGKEIRLDLEGEDTELDRTIVEELADPLVHMIRNSADHGLESPDEREAAGKPRTGTITLRAFHQGGCIVIQIADDGRGLDAERIRRKAVERGLVRSDERLDTAACHDLIFLPGFSTAEQVTGLSGRGVGMDVVRRNIEKIRGRVEVESVAGRGTTFTLHVPLTLAIIEGLIVGVGDQRYVIPTLSVRESFRPAAGMVSTVHGRGELVSVRGRLVPLVRLGRHLGTPARAEDPTTGIVVVVDAGHERRCLLADELLGKQEVVIKSLGDLFARRGDFAGAAILGDGRVGLILDTSALAHRTAAADEVAA